MDTPGTVSASTKPPLSGKTVCLAPIEEGEPVKVPIEVIPSIVTIKNLLDDMGGNVDPDIAVPVKVKREQLQKSVDWCIHHLGDVFPEDDRYTPIPAWDKEFTNIPKVELIDILLAANYLDIKPLLNLICKTIAQSVYGKTQEEIKEMYKIPTDTPK